MIVSGMLSHFSTALLQMDVSEEEEQEAGGADSFLRFLYSDSETG
jgi:hypothetical protein